MTAPSDEDPTRTGNARVDAAVERLSELETTPVESHAAIYEDVHEQLRSSLADAGSGSAS
ncbi:hypothetical protein MU582_12145 [Nocardioidaceae bacterium SCSIO 66511]|nr:hypothetical protein MU582_12145 [Nocardioidaceae bacterium SCSIO 66511]